MGLMMWKPTIPSTVYKIYGEDYEYLFDQIRVNGYRRARIDGQPRDLGDNLELDEDQAFSLENIEEVRHKALIPIETALDDISALALTGEDAAKVRDGQAVSASGMNPVSDVDILAKVDGKPLALGSCRDGQFFPRRVLLLDE